MRCITTISLATLALADIGCSAYEQDLASNDRIIGGKDTDITEVPWQVSVQANGDHWCGGVIIDPVWVLTAAHCMEGGTYSVKGGFTNRNEEGAVVSVKTVYKHEHYGGDATKGGDIALLRLSDRLELEEEDWEDKIQPIDLVVDDPQPGELALVSGWGYTAAESTGNLQSVHVPIVSNAAAMEAFKPFNGTVTDDQIAAGGVAGEDSCGGDSGGPLVVGSTLVGIVSYGYGCAEPGLPGMYARVSSFKGWIEEIQKSDPEVVDDDGGDDDGGDDDGGDDDDDGQCGDDEDGDSEDGDSEDDRGVHCGEIKVCGEDLVDGDAQAQNECPQLCENEGGAAFTGKWLEDDGRLVCRCMKCDVVD